MEINNYPNTATSIDTGSFFDIDKYISPGVYQSQKVPAALIKEYMLSENIELLTVSVAQAKATGGTFTSLKTYIIDAAAGGDRILKLLAANGVTNQLYQTAIDMTTGEIGLYNLTDDVFLPYLPPYSTLPTAPTVDEDETKGYQVGYTIRAVDTSIEYICTDNTTGAAVWEAQSGTWIPILNPDGTVITTSPDIELALYSIVGNVVNVSISMKNIDADFSADGGTNIGNITIDTLPIPTGIPYFIGSAEFKVNGSITMPSLPLYLSLSADGTIVLYCDDLTFSFTGGRITVNFQYEIN